MTFAQYFLSLRRRLISLPTLLRTSVMLAKARAATGQVIESIAILPHPGLQFRTPKVESNFHSTLERPHGALACFEGNNSLAVYRLLARSSPLAQVSPGFFLFEMGYGAAERDAAQYSHLN